MTRQEIMRLEQQLPGSETIDRVYRAFEGDLRVVTVDDRGRERRYSVRYDMDGLPVLFRM